MSKKDKEKNEPRPASGFKLNLPEQYLDRVFIPVMLALALLLYAKYLTGSHMLFGSDFIGSGNYAMRKFMADYIKQHGTIAFWMPYMYSGLPTVASFYADIFYPLTVLLRLILPVHVAWTYTFVLQLFVAGLGTYVLLKELKLSATAAFLMALAYMFSGPLVSLTHEGHDGRLICSSLLPLVLFFLQRGISSRRLTYFLLSGAMIGLQLLSGHLQSAYYTGVAATIFFLWRAIVDYRDNRDLGQSLKFVGSFVLMLVFMGCLVALYYLPVYGNVANGVRGSDRGYAYATSWSMPPEETFDLVTASFSGGLDKYWGRNPFKHHSEYLGILPLILALIGVVFTWKERTTKFFFGLMLFGLLMSWGGHTPFYYIPYYLFPGVAKFRAPSLMFFVSAFSIIVLGGFGLKYLFGGFAEAKKDSKRLSRLLLWVAGIGVGLLILAAVAQGPITSLLSAISHSEPDRVTANYGSFLGGMVLAAVLVLVNVGLIHAVARRRLNPLAFSVVAGVVLIADLWILDFRYIKPFPPPADSFAPDEAVKFCRQNPGQYRVFPVFYNDAQNGMNKSDEGELLLYGIENIGGQHPNPLQSYMDYVGLDQTVMFQFPPNLTDRRFLDLLNVKYIVSIPLPDDISKYQPQAQQTIRMLRQYVTQPGLTPAYRSQQASIYRNDSMLPRAFTVDDYEVISDKVGLLNRLKDPTFDYRRRVLLSEEPVGAVHPAGSAEGDLGEATVTSYSPDRVVVQVRMARPGFLVLSENYHPDWSAKENGEALKILRANHTLRAVYLGTGPHTIEFRYYPKYFKLGLLLSLLALAVLALVGIFELFWLRRRPSAAAESPQPAS